MKSCLHALSMTASHLDCELLAQLPPLIAPEQASDFGSQLHRMAKTTIDFCHSFFYDEQLCELSKLLLAVIWTSMHFFTNAHRQHRKLPSNHPPFSTSMYIIIPRFHIGNLVYEYAVSLLMGDNL